MSKYAYLVYHKEYDAFLKQLRDLGVVHVTSSEPISEHPVIVDLTAEGRRVQAQVDYLESLLSEHGFGLQGDAGRPYLTRKECSRQLEKIEALREELSKCHSKIATLVKEKESLSPWGEFRYGDLERLRKAGYEVAFFTCPAAGYNESWETDYHAFIIDKSPSVYRFLTVTHVGEEIHIDADHARLPQKDMSQLTEAIDTEEARWKNIEDELLVVARKDLPSLKRLQLDIEDETIWTKVVAQTKHEADDKLMLLEGWIPVDKTAAMEQALASKSYYFQQLEITDEDDVPIKLKNNWFSRMFEVLTEMYGMPDYAEFDPTVILAPFFLLFFAMCMGDAGYGLVLILFGMAVKCGKVNIEMFKGLGTIITTLGVGTLIVGFFLGTAFGVDLTTVPFIPDSLKSLILKGEVAGYDIQMILALAIGVFHICLAMVMKAICYTQRYGFINTVSIWGWLLLILGGILTGILALCQVLSPDQTKWALIGIGIVSALGIYVFNTPGRNPLANIGSGLWDTYNMVTGLLGDVLSYIRLYALGLAGGMLGAAFNSLGGMVLGDKPGIISWVAFAVILLFGHTLNLLMSALGAFVHPLRLTFVEYFKNAGYHGKGIKYDPFALKQKI